MPLFIIYPNKKTALFRRWFLTADARSANFLTPEQEYYDIINHNTEDIAAIEIVKLESVTISGLPTQRYDYSIFFTAHELATAVSELPADWDYGSSVL